jgi:hypothetical protein
MVLSAMTVLRGENGGEEPSQRLSTAACKEERTAACGQSGLSALKRSLSAVSRRGRTAETFAKTERKKEGKRAPKLPSGDIPESPQDLRRQ